MISIVRSSERFHKQAGWLDTRWHFSFDDYYDAQNMGWGILRVFNDDVVAPGGKFPMHPHANFEIVTIVLEGALAHADSEGHKGITSADEVQVMTAGRGVLHSEAAHGRLPVHLLQIWLEPKEKGLGPGWKQHAFIPRDFENKLCPLVSGSAAVKAPLSIYADAVIYRSKISKAAESTEYHFSGARRAYLFVIAGELALNGETLRPGDSAKIKGEKKLEWRTPSSCDFVLFDLPG